jgi:translation initiation factor 1 (eIF-1/SUI1)
LNNFVFGAAGQGASDLITNFRAETDTPALNSGVTIVTETSGTSGLTVQLIDGASVTLSGLTGRLESSLANNGSVWT